MLPTLRRVGSKTTERKSGSTFVSTLLVKVWPSLSSFWRWPFDAMSEDLVEEDARGASGEDRRSDERLRLGRFQQIRDDRWRRDRRRPAASLSSGSPDCVHGFKRLERAEVGAVGGLRGRRDHHAREAAAVRDARAFGVDEVARIGLRHHRDVRRQHARVVLEARRELADAFLSTPPPLNLQLGRQPARKWRAASVEKSSESSSAATFTCVLVLIRMSRSAAAR